MAHSNIEKLKNIVAKLRAPNGCPWDIKQTPKSIAPHIIEEAYELVDAIESDEDNRIIDELSDQLLHVVMISQMMSEKKRFTFEDIVNHCCEKMIRRHPHIFSNKSASTIDEVNNLWEEIKTKESNGSKHIMASIPNGFPALLHAHKIQKKAAALGFDWPDVSGTKEKLIEECQELLAAKTTTNINEEIGDILFTIANICRKLNKSAEDLLQKANKKFKNRFNTLEDITHSNNKRLIDLNLTQLDAYWDQAKKLTK